MPKGSGTADSCPPLQSVVRRLSKLPFGIACLSQCLEKGEQAVARLEAGTLAVVVWLKLAQNCLLECEVGMQIDMRRFDAFMTEPQRDHRTIDARLQKLHRSAVPQHVRRYSFRFQ